MAILGIGVVDSMQRHNATKNVLAFIVNGVAAVVFVVLSFVDVPGIPGGQTEVNWGAALLIAVGSTIGGQLGATVGRRLPPDRASWRDRARRRRRGGQLRDVSAPRDDRIATAPGCHGGEHEPCLLRHRARRGGDDAGVGIRAVDGDAELHEPACGRRPSRRA